MATLSTQDEDERIAVRALDDMRNSARAASSSRLAAAAPLAPTDSRYLSLERVSHLPIVTTALRAYEQGKASSRVVRYGAGVVEYVGSQATSYLQPKEKERESAEGPIADAAQEQPASPSSPTAPEEQRQLSAPRSRWQTVLLEAGGLSAALSDDNLRRLRYCLHCLQYATEHIDQQILILRDFTDAIQRQFSPTAMPPDPDSSLTPEQQAKLAHIRQDIVQTVRQVVEVVSKYAGGSSLPEPARQRVKKFILTLPRRWAERSGAPASPTDAASLPPSAAAAGTTVNGKDKERESVTAAASGRAGSERRHLHHLERHRERGVRSSAVSSPASSRAASPTRSPRLSRTSRPGGAADAAPVSAHSAMRATQKVLSLAVESLDMMRGVTGVVKESLDRADAWVGRLKHVGVRRGVDGQEEVIVERRDEEDAAEAMDDGTRSAPADDRDRQSDYGFGYGYNSAPPFSASARMAYRENGGDEWETRSATTLSHSRNPSASGSVGDYFFSPASPYSSRSSLPGTPGPSAGIGAGLKKMSIDEILDKDLRQSRKEEDADADGDADAEADEEGKEKEKKMDVDA